MKVFNCICGYYTNDRQLAMEHVKEKARQGYVYTHQIEEVRD